jgi:4-amino-4-deoxy-L-arabinose transferase-like glycosyltransferase
VKQGLTAALVVLLLSSFSLLSTAQIFNDGVTCDEPVHLAAGYSYWFTNDYRLNPEHPPLVKRIAALPLFLLPLICKSCDPSRILTVRSADAQLAYYHWVRSLTVGGAFDEYSFAHFFLFGTTDKCRAWWKTLACRTCVKLPHDCFLNNADLLLRSARIILLIFPLLLGLLVFLWSKELWGLGGAFLSLTLFCFDPNFLAYGGLVLTDVPLTCLFFGTIYFFWRYCKRGTIYDAALTCIFFAMAIAAKYSALILVPILLCLWLLSIKDRRALRTGALVLLAASVCAYLFLWTQYSFRFTPVADVQKAQREQASVNMDDLPSQHRPAPGHLPLEHSLVNYETLSKLFKLYPEGNADPEKLPLGELSLFNPGTFDREQVAHPSSLFSRILLFASDRHLLPEAYIYGIAFVKEYSVFRRSYLFGDLSTHSIPSYFFWTFLLKSTLPFLILFAGAAVLLLLKPQLRSKDLLYLAVPAIIYFAVAIVSGLNIGHRHLLPIYPFLFVLIGCLATALPPWQTWRAKAIAATVFVCVAISSSVVFAPLLTPTLVFPDYLTYFNELAGGPSRGWESLLDSNLEWGQSLKYLSRWLNAHHITEPIYLCFVGGDDPLWEGIAHQQVIGGKCFEHSIGFKEMKGGYLAISISWLVGLNMQPRLNKLWNQFIHDRCSLVDVVDRCIYIFRVNPESSSPPQ